MSTKVCILDYGSGNTKSVYNLIESLLPEVSISNSISAIEDATHIVLPGVGAFGTSMEKIRQSIPMDSLMDSLFVKKKPFLGICVGMQVMASVGFEFEENNGLEWIDGEIVKLNSNGFPLPHVGWNSISIKKESRIFQGIEDKSDFYFVHSYAFKPVNKDLIISTTQYGEEFCSAIEYNNLFGVQFHPEKSHYAGKRLIENFINLK
jgi:glutamine amidotransferase